MYISLLVVVITGKAINLIKADLTKASGPYIYSYISYFLVSSLINKYIILILTMFASACNTLPRPQAGRLAKVGLKVGLQGLPS